MSDSVESIVFTCKECTETFTSAKELKMHVIQESINEVDTVCHQRGAQKLVDLLRKGLVQEDKCGTANLRKLREKTYGLFLDNRPGSH